MSPLLAKIAFSFFPTSHRSHQLALPTSPLVRFSLSNQPQQPKEEMQMPFIAQYLVSSFDFSPDRALKVSSYRNLAIIKTRDRPDLVVSFLKEIGLSDSEIKSTISSFPALLCLNVDKRLKPHARELMDAGFTGELLVQLIQSNPQCLSLKGTLSRLQFWRKFVGYRDDLLLKVIKNHYLLITCDIDKTIVPKINLLREYGLSDQQIVKLVTRLRGFLFQSVDSLKSALERTEQLGFLRESKMFMHGLVFVGGLKKETFENKVAVFMEMYGWSEEEVYTAFRKLPNLFGLSSENIKLKMEFLINVAGIEPRKIVSRPNLLSYSVKSRLAPRHNVLSALRAKGFVTKLSFLSVSVMSEKRFIERFIVPYVKDVPELRDMYPAFCGEIEKASV